MSVGLAAEHPLVPAREGHERMAGSDAQRQDGPREVVPVDDQARAAQARGGNCYKKGRDRRRILDEDHVGLAQDDQEHPD